MNNVLIDDRRIKVDFSQSVAHLWKQFKKWVPLKAQPFGGVGRKVVGAGRHAARQAIVAALKGAKQTRAARRAQGPEKTALAESATTEGMGNRHRGA